LISAENKTQIAKALTINKIDMLPNNGSVSIVVINDS
jgi:hypothetical protein